MYRIAMALMLGMALFLVTYGQFNGMPGHVHDSPSLAAVLQEALAACLSSDAGELCSFSRDYLNQVSVIHDATTLILVVAARFAILVAFA